MINYLKLLLGLKDTSKVSLNMSASGKAMPIHTKVKIPGGWKLLGELAVGDEVIGPRGNITLVTEVIPQGTTDLYKFIFEDGRVAESHPLHLWEVFEGQNPSTYTTTTLDVIEHFNEFEYAIPLVKEISGSNYRIDKNVIQELTSLLINDKAIVDKDIQELHYQDRLAIARTMRGYEGCLATNGVVKYITEGRQSAVNFQHLVWSVGGIAELTNTEDSYIVTARHREIEGQDELTRELSTKLKIVGIVKELPTETVCINIDSKDKLFVVDNWIVTHNLCIN